MTFPGPKLRRAAAGLVSDALRNAAKVGMPVDIRDGALFVGEYEMRPDGSGGLIVTVTKQEAADGKAG